jgi:hypothetical protein
MPFFHFLAEHLYNFVGQLMICPYGGSGLYQLMSRGHGCPKIGDKRVIVIAVRHKKYDFSEFGLHFRDIVSTFCVPTISLSAQPLTISQRTQL